MILWKSRKIDIIKIRGNRKKQVNNRGRAEYEYGEEKKTEKDASSGI